MIKEREYKEAIEKLEGIYINGVYQGHYDTSSCVKLKESFSKEMLSELVKKGVLTLYKRISCKCCNKKVLDIRSEEIELYKEYFAIKTKKDKNMQDIMSLESLAQIIDLRFMCKKCGRKYIINSAKNMNTLKKQNVYKIIISNIKNHYF